MKHFYTDEENTLILISLLKAHDIKRIIASPGTTNISFVGSVQFDPFFEVYSAVDERAAAFMACGLAEETGEPVVLTCTGATASRNYLPGLTEAYYRHLPILAVTSSQHLGRVGNNVAQVIDRSEPFKDAVKKNLSISTISSREDKESAITEINDAILELRHGVWGPVHLNLVTTYSNNFTVKELPRYRVIKRIVDDNIPRLPKGKIGIFIGGHPKFTKQETELIDRFCATNNAVVIVDHISNYRGKYRFLASLVNAQEQNLGTKEFDLIIYLGSIHGAYISFVGKELWRVSPDGIIRDPYRNLTYVFEMQERDFFKRYIGKEERNDIFAVCRSADEKVREKIPELPFSNMWIAQQTAKNIPQGSILHLSILNTLRTWNYFETDEDVLCYSNSGGYGIDGCLSSAIGSALTNRNIEHYLIIGDLSFFYDLDSIFNEIPSNLHIMLVNNGVGTEFKNYNHRAAMFGNDADRYIAAKGHNGYKSLDIVKNICLNSNIEYFCASTKEDYLKLMNRWIKKSNNPVLLEVFTTDENESAALKIVNSIARDTSFKTFLKKFLVFRLIKRIIRGA